MAKIEFLDTPKIQFFYRVQNKRGRVLKFLTSVLFHQTYNISKNQPDPMTGVGAMTIFVHFCPIFAHFRNFDEYCCYSHPNRQIVRQKLKLPVCTAIAPKFWKIAFVAKISPENGFSAKFSIFREIRTDSSIALSARVVCKISGKLDFICQKIFLLETNAR